MSSKNKDALSVILLPLSGAGSRSGSSAETVPEFSLRDTIEVAPRPEIAKTNKNPEWIEPDRKIYWFVLLVSLCLLIFGVLVVIFFGTLFNLILDKEIALKDGSMTFKWWKLPPVNPVIKVYVYNVTNADAFLNNGEKPILDELGPFTYIETWEKVNVKFHDNGTISYQQQKIFVFDPENSVGSEDDMVVIPNIPMLSATSQSKHAARFLRLAMASIMDILKIKPFVEVSVGQLLWGYEDPLLKLAKDVVPKEQKLPYEEFGLMYGLEAIAKSQVLPTVESILSAVRVDSLLDYAGKGLEFLLGVPDPDEHKHIQKFRASHTYRGQERKQEIFGVMEGKNGTAKDIITVFSGKGDITKLNLIERFNGVTHLPHWKTEACNRLNGSDGSLFPPHMTQNTTLHVYEKDLCRLLPLRFQKEIETKEGILGYRFSPPKDVFAEIAQNPENECFCPAGPPCSPHGLFNVSLCQYDSPIMVSFPHFYLADPKLREAVEGISEPDPEKHQLYIDVQPEMGVALAARARVQINLAVSQVVDIKQVATFPDIVFPIMWFEDGIDGLPEEVTNLLSLATKAPPIAKSAICYSLFIAGAILFVLSLTCIIRSSSRQESLNLEGTSHYVKPEKSKNGHSMGVNPAFEGSNMNINS